MKVLIGYDGSEFGQRAIDDLSRAGLPEDVEIRVATVADLWVHLPKSCYEITEPAELEKMSPVVRRAHELAGDAMKEARATAAEGAQRVRGRFPKGTVGAEACAGSPAKALVEQAQQWGADLIVVGSHGRGAVARAVLGSVSQSVLSYAGCSVRIARPREEAAGAPPSADQPVRIVLAIDGSPQSAAAINAISLRRWPAGTEVRVVIAIDLRLATVVPAMMPDFTWPVPIGTPAEAEDRDWPRHAAHAAADELRHAGLNASPLLREGDPRQVLLEEADAMHADCIFLGARGHGRLEGFLLGSVSASVAARAGCSVEVVRFE